MAVGRGFSPIPRNYLHTKILFSRNGNVWCVDLWSGIEILIDCRVVGRWRLGVPADLFLFQFCTRCGFSWGGRFGNLFGWICGPVCVGLWNRYEISKARWLYGRWPVSVFEKLNDRQFEIHVHMHTGDLLALRFSCHQLQLIAACQTVLLNT